MKVYYLNFAKIIKWLLISTVLVAGIYVLNVTLWQDNTVPTMKNYEPIYQGSDDQKKVALICNVVWGEEFLPDMLKTLKEEKVNITFFVGGQWAEKFPELLKQMSAQKHEIGNHGYAHLHPTKISLNKNIDEIENTEKIIKKITGKGTKLFHPPYREINDKVAEEVGKYGYKTIMSSVDTIDWQRPPAGVIVDRVMGKVHNGAIILMHPTDPTKQALGEMIKNLKEQGYELVTVSELLNGQVNPEKKFDKDVGEQKQNNN